MRDSEEDGRWLWCINFPSWEGTKGWGKKGKNLLDEQYIVCQCVYIAMMTFDKDTLIAAGLSVDGLTFGNNYPPYHKELVPLARNLRTHSTRAEIYLWQLLKNLLTGYRFTRQKPILNYIADFYCHELLCVVEVDGFTHQSAEDAADDRRRDSQMQAIGLRVVRLDDAAVIRNPIVEAQRIFFSLGVDMPERLCRPAFGMERIFTP